MVLIASTQVPEVYECKATQHTSSRIDGYLDLQVDGLHSYQFAVAYCERLCFVIAACWWCSLRSGLHLSQLAWWFFTSCMVVQCHDHCNTGHSHLSWVVRIRSIACIPVAMTAITCTLLHNAMHEIPPLLGACVALYMLAQVQSTLYMLYMHRVTVFMLLQPLGNC